MRPRFEARSAVFLSFLVSTGCSSAATANPAAEAPPDAGGTGSTCDASFGSARYYVSLDATWSRETHPTAFVEGAHMTPLVGASHNAGYVVWHEGELASYGVQTVAETGNPAPLGKEIDKAYAAGTAFATVHGSGISVPGTDRTIVDVEPAHPLVSLEAMVAPSPDWFTGVDSVALCGKAGWIDDLTLEARVYDAGTKSGEVLDYTGSPTKDPIDLRDYGLFAGKTLIGSFHFVRKP
jgi:hypothetical protein